MLPRILPEDHFKVAVKGEKTQTGPNDLSWVDRGRPKQLGSVEQNASGWRPVERILGDLKRNILILASFSVH